MPVDVGFMDLSSCTVNQVELDVPVKTLFARTESQRDALQYQRKRLSTEASAEQDIEFRKEFARKSHQPVDTEDILPALTEAGIELAHPTWHKAQFQASIHNKKLETLAAAGFLRGQSLRETTLLCPGPEDILYPGKPHNRLPI